MESADKRRVSMSGTCRVTRHWAIAGQTSRGEHSRMPQFRLI